MTIAAAHLGLLSAVKGIGAAAGELAAIGNAAEWLNSPRLTSAGLNGKVVLVDFWTYTCINWLRTLPYIRALGVQIQGSRPGRDRRAHARIRIRKKPRQRPPGRHANADRRIRSRSTTTTRSGVRSTTNTGRPSTSSTARTRSPASFRRRASTSVRDDHSAAADGGWRRRSARWPGVGRRGRDRDGGGLGQPAVAGELPRLRANRNFASPGGVKRDRRFALCRTNRPWPQ